MTKSKHGRVIKPSRNITKEDTITFRSFYTHDIPASINAKTNLLTALGLLCYTEFIGGLINNKVGVRTANRSNFYAAYNLLGDTYKAFDTMLKDNFGSDFYGFFRNGLVHEYYAKGSFVIAPKSNTGSAVGFHKGTTPSMANEPYYTDLLRILDDHISKI